MSPNPYESPQVGQPQMSPAITSVHLQPFLAWERLRIWFNVVLVSVVLLGVFSMPRQWTNPHLHRTCIEGAIVANLFFCVGLVAESYLRFAGWWREWQRGAMFTLGTLATATGAFLEIGRFG